MEHNESSFRMKSLTIFALQAGIENPPNALSAGKCSSSADNNESGGNPDQDEKEVKA